MFIFLGSIYPDELFNALKSRNQFIDYPANIFQYSLLKGLDNQYEELRVVTSPVIRSRCSDVWDICKRCFFSHRGSGNKRDIYVGTIPLSGLQLIVEFWRVYWLLRKELNSSKQNNNLFVYALHSPFLLAAVLLRRKICCTCVVVPDLPEYMTSKSDFFRKTGKKIDRTIINFCLKRLDCYVLLSERMRDKLPIKDKPWVLIEGIYDITPLFGYSVRSNKHGNERIIFYGGNLSRRYGILELLEAFHGIDKENYRLWVCGDGDCKDIVIRMALEDSRINYLGIVSHDEVLSLEQKSSVLVNPRSSTGEYTKYSFPSKTMEYLASGTPTIMCHLPAIPKEYDEYILYIEDESVEGIRNKLIEVCEMPQKELDEFGKKASEFIRTQKNAFIQSKRIVDLIRQIEKDV